MIFRPKEVRGNLGAAENKFAFHFTPFGAVVHSLYGGTFLLFVKWCGFNDHHKFQEWRRHHLRCFFYVNKLKHNKYSVPEMIKRAIAQGHSLYHLDFIIYALDHSVVIAVFYHIYYIYGIFFGCPDSLLS